MKQHKQWCSVWNMYISGGRTEIRLGGWRERLWSSQLSAWSIRMQKAKIEGLKPPPPPPLMYITINCWILSSSANTIITNTSLFKLKDLVAKQENTGIYIKKWCQIKQLIDLADLLQSNYTHSVNNKWRSQNQNGQTKPVDSISYTIFCLENNNIHGNDRYLT